MKFIGGTYLRCHKPHQAEKEGQSEKLIRIIAGTEAEAEGEGEAVKITEAEVEATGSIRHDQIVLLPH